MDTSILSQIAALQRMSVNELREQWLRHFGEPARSSNKHFLFRRLAWRLQELQHGGLSRSARYRIDQLAADGFEPACTSKRADAHEMPPPPHRSPVRDRRLPVPGSVISKTYRGRELRVVSRDGGFEFDGAMYPSLTALAKHITGSKSINGKLFFGLTQRKR